MAASAAPAIVRRRVRAPRFALRPVAATPRIGLLLSALLHLAFIAILTWLPILVPAPSMIVTGVGLRHEADLQLLFLPSLPPMSEVGPGADIQHGSEEAHRVVETLPGADRLTPNRPKPDYAGAQEVVSNPSDSTNGVQTIRRPDLVAPPTLAYPLRLPSLLMLPAPAIPAPVTPRIDPPVLSNPEEPSPFRASDPPVEVPVLPIDLPKLSVAPAEPMAPKTIGSSEPSFPVAAATTDSSAVGAPPAVVVLNAVSVPPEPFPIIPDAELAARFVVGPTRDASALETASEAAGGSSAGAGASNAGKNLPNPSVENGSGTRVKADGKYAEVASTEFALNMRSARSESSGGGTTAAAGNKGLPGISISGGVTGHSDNGRVVATSPNPRGSYALTIISGGSSGGASRDLGVFARSDTVYTVYIPMTDTGGGPDWPMQYTLMNSAPAHGSREGLLTPPIVLKKIQATAPKTDLTANSGPVFVTGIIDENGKPQALRAIRALDPRAQWAVHALAQWEFLATQLEGKPVASKILIGVSVMPAEEAGKRD